jgi:hypothetical protein
MTIEEVRKQKNTGMLAIPEGGASHGHLSLRLLEAYKETISRLISSSFVRVTLGKTLFQLFLNNSQP